MTRRRPSIGLFGFIGRSKDLRQLDDALRSVDLHPRLVPEAVKITLVGLIKDHVNRDEPAPQTYRASAELLAYCMLGAEAFAGANDLPLTEHVEKRVAQAMSDGDTLDAQIILLTMHANVLQPSIREHFGLETSDA